MEHIGAVHLKRSWCSQTLKAVRLDSGGEGRAFEPADDIWTKETISIGDIQHGATDGKKIWFFLSSVESQWYNDTILFSVL